MRAEYFAPAGAAGLPSPASGLDLALPPGIDRMSRVGWTTRQWLIAIAAVAV